MKYIILTGLIGLATARGCRQDDEADFILTDDGDTIFKTEVEVQWRRFKYQSDSALYAADVQISEALRVLAKEQTPSKFILWTDIVRAERLVERLGDKQEAGQRFEDDAAIFDKKKLREMEIYQKRYKQIEAKLGKALKKMKAHQTGR